MVTLTPALRVRRRSVGVPYFYLIINIKMMTGTDGGSGDSWNTAGYSLH
ncbi:hypothetical protein [Paenibacillus alba]|nr:hypothetical protein [Paenibacillus alba]